MKKLLALLLAALLLGAPLASAEPALVISSPVLRVSEGGEETVLDLSGLRLALAPVWTEDSLGLAVNAYDRDRLLLAAELQFRHEDILLAMDGLSRTYCVSYSELFRELTGQELPTLDLRGIWMLLQRELEISREEGEIRVSLSHTATNELLGLLLPTIRKVDYDSCELLSDYLDQLQANDSGYALQGVFRQDESGWSGQLAIYYVAMGKPKDIPFLAVDYSLSRNASGGYLLSLEAYGDTSFDGKRRDFASLEASLSETADGDAQFQLEVKCAVDGSETLTPVFAAEGYIRPEANGLSLHAVLSSLDYASDALREFAAFDLSITSDGESVSLRASVSSPAGGGYREQAALELMIQNKNGVVTLHLEGLERDYSKGALVPVFASELRIRPGAGKLTLELDHSQRDYGLEKLTPEFSASVEFNYGPESVSMEFSCSARDYGNDKLRPVFGLNAELRRSASEDTLQITVLEGYSAGLKPVSRINGSLKHVMNGEDFRLQFSSMDYYSGRLRPVFALSGKARSRSGEQRSRDGEQRSPFDERTLHVEFSLDEDDSGTLRHIATLDSILRGSGTGGSLHAELLLDYALNGDFEKIAELDAALEEEFTLSVKLEGREWLDLSYRRSDGCLSVKYRSEGGWTRYEFNSFVTLEETALSRCSFDAERAVKVFEMSDEEIARFERELQSATAKLVGFLYPVLVEAGLV